MGLNLNGTVDVPECETLEERAILRYVEELIV